MFDFKEIAEEARSFYNVGFKYLVSEHKPGTEAIPYYVDIAFACELFMKAIIAYKNPNISKADFKKLGHCLDDLFNALPDNAKEEIQAKIPDSKIKVKNDEMVSICTKGLKDDLPAGVKKNLEHIIENPISSFEEILKKHANIFAEWRYYYETNNFISCDEWFLLNFSTELHNYMASIMNSLN